MVTLGNYTYGEHRAIQRTVKSLCCISETKIILHVNYTSIILFLKYALMTEPARHPNSKYAFKRKKENKEVGTELTVLT